jgi:hypothetical protein
MLIEYTGDNSVFPSDADGIFGAIGTSDKVRHKVRGNHHGQPLAAGEKIGQETTGALVTEWMARKFG